MPRRAPPGSSPRQARTVIPFPLLRGKKPLTRKARGFQFSFRWACPVSCRAQVNSYVMQQPPAPPKTHERSPLPSGQAASDFPASKRR